MKYFGFLVRFVVLPLLLLRFLAWRDQRRGKVLPSSMGSWSEEAVLLGHVAVAVAYTTPWDNYLVANGVWSYNPDLVTGLTLGYVPIEEYTFFVLQSLLTGSWTHYLARRMKAEASSLTAQQTLMPRLAATAGLGILWVAGMRRLLASENKDDYLGLIVGWALPPIMFQTAFGGDILWRNRALIAASILPATAYLGVSDSLAIGSGTWQINPENTIKTEVIKNLPFEELLFFLLTNVLLVFGITLVQSKESENRLPAFIRPAYDRWKARMQNERLSGQS
ncbi:MAG: lycopene cyclase domain-containing protein [bacterium]|nr:lycopene cyclase domain-containing protein [bacterium]